MILKTLGELKTKKDFYVLDIETYTLSAVSENLWFGCIYGNNYKGYFRTHREFHKLISLPRFKKSIIYAHNGGGFDYLCLFPNLMELEVIYNGSRFIFLDYKGITFADSLNIFKTSVKELGKLLGHEKGIMESNIGQVKKGTIPTAKDIEYCFLDCEIVYESLKNVFDDVKPSLTVGSLAMQVYRRKYLKSPLKFDDKIEREYIDGYFGGRTEAFKLGRCKCNVYDINSMYPAAMLRSNFPHPSFSYIEKKPDLVRFKRFVMSREGICCVRVKVPHSMKYKPLPIIKGDKLIFPSGTFWGTWCNNELRYAMSLGVQVLAVKKMVGSTRLIRGADLFGEYVTYFYEQKNKATGIQKEYFKLMLNNLYGKFGQHKFSETKYFKDISLAVKFLKETKLKDKHLYKINKFNEKRPDCYIQKDEDKITTHSLISIAAYITAASRIMLHQMMNNFDVYYCDTDSLFIPENSIQPETGNALGQLKKENYQVVNIYGLKNYTKKENSILNRKIKGIPKNAKKVSANKYSYNTIVKPKAALRRNLEIGSLQKIIKIVSNNYTKGTIHKNKIIKAHKLKD